MDEFYSHLNRLLDDEISNVRSLIGEVATMAEASHELLLAAVVSLSPDVLNATRECEAAMRDAEARLDQEGGTDTREAEAEGSLPPQSHDNSGHTVEVKIDCTESVDGDTYIEVDLVSPDSTMDGCLRS